MKPHFAIEFRYTTDPHTLPEDGVRWRRTHQRKGFRPSQGVVYIREGTPRDLTFARAYGWFRHTVDNMPAFAAAVRLVERDEDDETIEHVQYFPGKDPSVKGASMTWDEVRDHHRLLDKIVEELEAVEEKRDRLKTSLIVESLRRRRADLNAENFEEDVPDNGVASGRVVADSGWECTDVMRNVYGFCIYDDDEDPCHDNCLFCHEPEERK